MPIFFRFVLCSVRNVVKILILAMVGIMDRCISGVFLVFRVGWKGGWVTGKALEDICRACVVAIRGI